MGLETLQQQIISEVSRRASEYATIADRLYREPETALKEFHSSAMLADFLENEGFLVEKGVAGMETAFIASHGEAGPAIALLAEMDALPEIGHACGHNIIAAAAVGAAVTLRHLLEPNQARIHVIATPAEEIGVGKIELVKGGIFQAIDFAMMVHPSSKRQVIKEYLGMAKVRFTFFGRVAHAAAYPEEGINALDAVIQTYNGINAMRQHFRQDVRVHGIITNGGVAPNIIPGEAGCYFYVRATDLEEVARVKAKVVSCAEGAALATGCRVEVDDNPRVLAPLRINRAFSALYSEQLRLLGLPEADAPTDRNRGSSDIGNVSQVVPTIHPHVPIGDGVHIHTREFAEATVSPKGKAAVTEGATALALAAAGLIFRPEVADSIRREFEAYD